MQHVVENTNPNAIRILICEDEIIIAEDVAAYVCSLGYQTAGIVHNGEDAVVAAEATKPDLILM
ncbi:MAG: hypothetical protein V2B18_05570, partial [Pseudomonadota bacterium]